MAASDWLRQQGSLVEAECQAALIRATTERTAQLIATHGGDLLQRWLETFASQLRSSPDDTTTVAATLRNQVDELLAWADFGAHLTQPWSVVLCGRPNVGKSSLINALAGFTRSIVSPQPGTTRDVVTEKVAFDGWPVELADTAGLRSTDDAIESQGVERAVAQLAAADLQLLLLDASAPLTDEDLRLLAAHPDAVRIAHKCDLPAAWSLPEALAVSAATGAGVAELIDAIVVRLVPQTPPAEVPVPVSPRVTQELRRVRDARGCAYARCRVAGARGAGDVSSSTAAPRLGRAQGLFAPHTGVDRVDSMLDSHDRPADAIAVALTTPAA